MTVHKQPDDWPLIVLAVLGGMVILTCALVLWKLTGVRGRTHLRLGPGMIQTITCRRRQPEPLIRSYPMERGTLAIITRQPIPWGVPQGDTLLLARGDQHDTISLSGMAKAKKHLQTVWQAVLSTAPIPCLEGAIPPLSRHS